MGQPSKVIVNAQPMMINTGGPASDQSDKITDDDSVGAADMPMQFQMYSELTSKVFGNEKG